MSAKSPRSGPSHVSPRTTSAKPQANLNHFSALSPDFAPNMLPDDMSTRRLIVYSREELLRLARPSVGHGYPAPAGMGALETWFGAPSTAAPAASTTEPSASASSESASGRRQGGFGEGFGYGGGIGGRGLGGRGGRNPGLKRQQHDGLRNVPAPPAMGRDHLNAMFAKLSPQDPHDSAPKQQDRRDRRREDEWRRNGESSRRPFTAVGDDDVAPAWLNDGSTGSTDASLVSGYAAFGADQTGGLSSFRSRPGHRGAPEPTQRSAKQLVSFFGEAPAVVAAEAPAPKNKVFDSANYLLPQKAQPAVTDAPQMLQTDKEAPVAKSRFQRFFGTAAPSAAPSEQPVRPPVEDCPTMWNPNAANNGRAFASGMSPPPDRPSSGSGPDHFSRLMGILSNNTPPPDHMASTHLSEPERGIPHHAPFGISSPPVPPPGFSGPPLPPNFAPPAFNGMSAQDLLLNQTSGMRYSEPPRGMAQGPPVEFPVSPPPHPALHGGMPYQTQADARFHHNGPPPTGYLHPPQLRSPPGPHQQDMLASLFAGLGRPSGPQ